MKEAKDAKRGKNIFGSGSELIGGESHNIKLSLVFTQNLSRLKEKGGENN